MSLILFHTRKVRAALTAPAAMGMDLFFVLLITALVAGAIMFGQQFTAPYHAGTVIDLSYSALPKYTLFSLCRGLAAYLLSLLFTLVYGTIAAHHARAEKIMMPALDVLQAIPVLGFLPGLVLTMIALFPRREIGLELACILMIFTGQAWNMTFSFHGSLRGIPAAMREVAAVNRLGSWQTFRILEVPAAMIGLVWNSMMSMAGGWFFLTVNEAFTLGSRDYRLPGIGSYMNEAINRGNVPAIAAALVAMAVMILALDQVFWRPIVVWSRKYKMEETAEAEAPRSWVLELLGRSRLYRRLVGLWSVRRPKIAGAAIHLDGPSIPRAVRMAARRAGRALRLLFLLLPAGAAVWGLYSMLRLLAALPLLHPSDDRDWAHVLLALGASFGRTSAAVLLGAVWALPAGVWIGRSEKWSRRLQPVVQIIASFPAPMVFPLVTMMLLAMHVPFTFGCIALMLLGAQWYILFNVIAGASAIPADLKEVARIHRFTHWGVWKNLYLPCVFPYLLTGLITAAGGAWNATIIAEYVNFSDRTYVAFGLGSTISRATADGNFPLLCASVTTMAVFVVMINHLFWKRLYRLAENRFSLNV